MNKDQPKFEIREYYKQKMVYSVRSAGDEIDLIFPNITALVNFFAKGSLFPADITKDYDRIVRAIRADKLYVLVTAVTTYKIKQIAVYGILQKSRKRFKVGAVACVDHKFWRQLDVHAEYIGDVCEKCGYFSPSPHGQGKQFHIKRLRESIEASKPVKTANPSKVSTVQTKLVK